MRKAAVALCALLLAASLSACAGSGGGTLTVWCADMDKDMIGRMADAFLATDPGIKSITVEVYEDNVVRETIEKDPAAAADVICIPHDQLGALVAEGRLCAITEAKYTFDIRRNNPPAVKAGQIQGVQYGFPSSFETHMLFYDKSLISKEAAQTLEGILAGGAPDGGYAFAMDMSNAYFSVNWFFTFGCELYGENGDDPRLCDFNSPEGVAAMRALIEYSGRFLSCDGDSAIALMKERKLGAFIGGPWNAAAVTEALMGNYGCARLPSIDGKPMKSFAGYKLYCVNANTKHRDAAMELAYWLTNPENQKTRFLERNLIPVAGILNDDPDVSASASALAVMAQGPDAIAMPSIPEMSGFWAPAAALTQACYAGDVGAAGLQAELDALVNDVVKQ